MALALGEFPQTHHPLESGEGGRNLSLRDCYKHIHTPILEECFIDDLVRIFEYNGRGRAWIAPNDDWDIPLERSQRRKLHVQYGVLPSSFGHSRSSSPSIAACQTSVALGRGSVAVRTAEEVRREAARSCKIKHTSGYRTTQAKYLRSMVLIAKALALRRFLHQ